MRPQQFYYLYCNMKHIVLSVALLVTLNVCAQQLKYNNIAQYDADILANPQNPDLYFARAELKKNYLDFKGAVKDYETAIKKKSTYAAQAHYALGMLAMNYNSYPTIGKPVIAIGYSPANTHFTKAIELDTNYADAYFQSAKCKFYLDKYQQGILYFTKAIQLKAELAPEAYYYRGLCKSSAHDVNGACLDFSKAASLGNIYGTEMRERICR
jgi:tetratricopeptide (TPR) repeat protein